MLKSEGIFAVIEEELACESDSFVALWIGDFAENSKKKE
jgi:hypothetical protein